MDDEAADVDVETHEEEEGRAGGGLDPAPAQGAAKGRPSAGGSGEGGRAGSSSSGAGEEGEEVVVSFGTGVGLQRVREVMTEELSQRLVQALLALSWASALGHIQAMDEEYPLALDVASGGVPKRPSEEVNDTKAGGAGARRGEACAERGASNERDEPRGCGGGRRGGLHSGWHPCAWRSAALGTLGVHRGSAGGCHGGRWDPGGPCGRGGGGGGGGGGGEEEDLLCHTGEGKLHEDDNTSAHEAFELLSWCLGASMGPALTAHVFSLPLIDKFVVDTVLLSPARGCGACLRSSCSCSRRRGAP